MNEDPTETVKASATDTQSAPSSGTKIQERNIEDARILLSFVGRSAIDLPPEVVEPVVSSRSLLDDQLWNAADEAKFLESFSKLARMALPGYAPQYVDQRPQ